MNLTLDQIHAISGNSRYGPAKQAFMSRLEQASGTFPDLKRPHVIAQLLGQVCVESGYFRYTREIWGPTAAQKRYEGRADLGNTQPGDGKRFAGRDFIQCTGRHNYTQFTIWLRKIYPSCPDFVKDPEMLVDPDWLGWATIWYWTQRVPKQYVDAGNNEMVTRRVNGGLNHFAQRLASYDRAALVLLGQDPDDIRGFQQASGLKVDGISGPQTRRAMHTALSGAPALTGKAAGIGAAGAAAAGTAIAVAGEHGPTVAATFAVVAVVAAVIYLIRRKRK